MPGFDNGTMFADNVDFTGSSVSSGSPRVLLDGQLLIGSTATPHIRVATLTAGSGITILNGAGSITISASTGSFTWNDVSGAFVSTFQNGYFVTATASTTLPGSPSQGATIKFILDTTQALTITANAGQTIRLGANVTAAAGTAVSTARGDALELVFRSSDSSWIAQSSVGTWNLT